MAMSIATVIYRTTNIVRSFGRAAHPLRRIWVDPSEVRFCTPPSKYADVVQFDANRAHPHAAINRGYFFEWSNLGRTLDGAWDDLSVKFEDLLEYKAIADHIAGRSRWSCSEFAGRAEAWIKMGNASRGSITAKGFKEGRERELDLLIESISKIGVRPAKRSLSTLATIDDICVNISRTSEMLFNNRGHHRLAIAKCLTVTTVPVVILVTHRLCRSDALNFYSEKS